MSGCRFGAIGIPETLVDDACLQVATKSAATTATAGFVLRRNRHTPIRPMPFPLSIQVRSCLTPRGLGIDRNLIEIRFQNG